MSIAYTPKRAIRPDYQAALLSSLLLLTLMGSRAQDPSGRLIPRFTTHRLRVIPDASMLPAWRVSSAELSENLGVTDGVVSLQNVGELPITQARFYVEYYDAAGSLCFSLAFAGEANGRNSSAPMAPRESRKLYSEAVSLGSATEPVEARVRMISQVRGSAPEIGAGDGIMRMPVTGEAPVLKLNLDLDGMKGVPVVDLALGQVWVDSEGKLQRVEILNARDDTFRSWFQGFLAQMRFEPATSGFVHAAGTSLILVRAVKDRIVEADPIPLLTRQSGWLSGYHSRFGPIDPPPVIQLLLDRSPLITAFGPNAERRQAELSASVNEYQLGAPINWSENIFKWVEMNHTGPSVRQWKAPEDFSR